MTAKTLAVLLSLVAIAAPTAAFANTDRDPEIHGRSELAIESALRDKGVVATSVEEWGNYVRAYVRNDNGSTSMQFFDADTLAPVKLYNN